MPEVRTIKPFVDRRCKCARNVGAEFFCEDERAEMLVNDGFVEIIGVPAEEPSEEPKPKPRSRKKKVE